jgi:ribosomal protein L35
MESGKILKITKTGRIARNSPGSSHTIRENRPADARCVDAARRDKDPHE